MGAYLQLVTPGIPLLGAFLYAGVLRPAEAYDFECTSVFTNDDAHRRLPRRRPARGDLRHRAGDGRPRRRDRHRPGRAAPQQLHPDRGLPELHDRERAHCRLRRLPGRRQGGERCSATTRSGPSRRTQRERGDEAARHRLLDVLRDVRARALARAGLAELLGRRLGSGDDRVLPTAKVRVVTGVSPHGQGHETRGRRSSPTSSASAPTTSTCCTPTRRSTPLGMDTYGAAVVRGRRRRHRHGLREGHRQGRTARRPPARGARGGPRVRGRQRSRSRAPTRSVGTGARLQRLGRPTTCPTGWSRTSTATSPYDPPNFTWPFGAHCCVVEVDTETGAVESSEYVAVDDCGVQLNPLIVEGQVHGGVAQGIAQALFEEARLRRGGQPARPGRWPSTSCRRPPRAARRSSSTTPSRPARRTRWASRASARPARSPRRRR